MLDKTPEKAMAPHSSTLAWKIPWMEEPGGLQSMGSLRVRHDWATSLSLFTFMHWRRKWQPTPVFLPGESQGRGSLVGFRLWGCTELDTTEATWQQQQQIRPQNIPWKEWAVNTIRKVSRDHFESAQNFEQNFDIDEQCCAWRRCLIIQILLWIVTGPSTD